MFSRKNKIDGSVMVQQKAIESTWHEWPARSTKPFLLPRCTILHHNKPSIPNIFCTRRNSFHSLCVRRRARQVTKIIKASRGGETIQSRAAAGRDHARQPSRTQGECGGRQCSSAVGLKLHVRGARWRFAGQCLNYKSPILPCGTSAE